jgi:hypothetical protein
MITKLKKICGFCEGTGKAIIDYIESHCGICGGDGKRCFDKVASAATLWHTENIHTDTSADDIAEGASA